MSNSEEVVIAWTTIPTEMDASEVARELVNARLAACVSVVQKVHSTYRWEGKIEANEEQALMIKNDAHVREITRAPYSCAAQLRSSRICGHCSVGRLWSVSGLGEA